MGRVNQKGDITKGLQAKGLKKAKKHLPAEIAAEVQKKERKPHRWRPGTVALREIKRYQSSTAPLIPAAPFRRLVAEIVTEFGHGKAFRSTPGARAVLRESTEVYAVEMFKAMQESAIFRKHIGVSATDLDHVRAITGRYQKA